MEKITINKDKSFARFEARLPQEQKEFFIRAAALSGFRTLTDFILSTVRAKAEEIIEKNEQILASQRDKEIFFDALVNSESPNDALRKAASRYNDYFNERTNSDSKQTA